MLVKKLVFVCSLLVTLSSCQNQHDYREIGLIDTKLFQSLGRTLFVKPGFVTMKEIHLDKGLLVGHYIVIEGQVMSLGKFKTHMVVMDQTARVLVVLTDAIPALELSDQVVGKKIKILGSVEDGRKGLPYVMAKSYRVY